MRHLLQRPNETLNFYYLSKLHCRSRKQTYLVVMPDGRSLFLLAPYYPNSTGIIHHRGQVKNPHRLPIRKTSPRKSLPRRLFSDGKVLRLPVLSSFQGSVKSLAGIAVSFLRGDRRADRIYSDESVEWIASV
ncbi:hypothetical protein CDAR_494081 [Caerostris darwini]|uniref:Uncharacterized protein n=1 Tax=Caerostris darwini TaxID=1538125 RepID=A0AAV4MR69_9ARAC|nr:hypothetical protein CDAR_494081 [Caerostris darwini]